MKKIVAVIGLLSFLLLIGCEAETENAMSEKTNTEKNYPECLTKHDWIHYANCEETISFGEDGSYCYYCACGNPVGNSDLFDSYQYDEDSEEITLYPEEEGNKIKVLRYEKSRLLLGFDDGIKEFVDRSDELVSENPPDLTYNPEDYVYGFHSYIAIVEKDGNILITAPAGYDAEVLEYQEYLTEEKLSENPVFYQWTVKMVQTDDGEEFGDTCEELSEEQMTEMLEDGPAVGYIWYNDDLEIDKIVFFNSEIAEQD